MLSLQTKNNLITDDILFAIEISKIIGYYILKFT